MKISTVNSVDIPDAWFQCISKILEDGFKYDLNYLNDQVR